MVWRDRLSTRSVAHFPEKDGSTMGISDVTLSAYVLGDGSFENVMVTA
jgi:hypothetical protein